MTNILQINASIQGNQGQSSRLAENFVTALRTAQPGTQLTVRDLSRETLPHLDAGRFGAFLAKPEARTPEQQAVVNDSNELIEELRRADLIVIGLPLYNFHVPSQLKAWIDHVARAGETFRYTEKGPVGLLTGKRAVVFATRGGWYAGTPADTQTGYIRNVLGFIGITDVDFVYAEGLAVSPESREKSLAAANDEARNLAGTLLGDALGRAAAGPVLEQAAFA